MVSACQNFYRAELKDDLDRAARPGGTLESELFFLKEISLAVILKMISVIGPLLVSVSGCGALLVPTN